MGQFCIFPQNLGKNKIKKSRFSQCRQLADGLAHNILKHKENALREGQCHRIKKPMFINDASMFFWPLQDLNFF